MAKKYRFRRVDLDQEWTAPLGYWRLYQRIRKASKNIAPGPFNLKLWENYTSSDWGPDLTRQEAVTRLMNKLKRSSVGQVWSMRASKGKLAVRVVEVKPPLVNTVGNDRIDVIYTEIFTKWKGEVENWGICNCRRICDGCPWSQHAYCNAIDIHGSTTVMAEIANYLVHNASRLKVAHVIYNRRVWSPEAGWHSYTGVSPHTDHVHVDCFPQGTGTPPCAK